MHIHIPIHIIHVYIYIFTPHIIYIYISYSYHIISCFHTHTHVCMYDMCVIAFSGRKAAAIQAGDRGWGPPTQHHPHGAVDGSWGWPWLTMVERLICMRLKGHYFDQTNWIPSILMIWWMRGEFVSYMCFPCTFGVILAIIRPNWLIRVGGDTTGHALWDKSVPCAPVISERSSLQHLRFRWGKAARRRPSSAGRRWKEARGDSEDRDRRWTQRCSRASPRVPWQLSLW